MSKVTSEIIQQAGKIATKVDNRTYQTTITQLENSINQRVRKGDVVAEINAAIDPETGISKVQIEAGAINLNGVVTANDNFKILEDGSMETDKGTFKEYLRLANKQNDIDTYFVIGAVPELSVMGDIEYTYGPGLNGTSIEELFVEGSHNALSIYDNLGVDFGELFVRQLYSTSIYSDAFRSNKITTSAIDCLNLKAWDIQTQTLVLTDLYLNNRKDHNLITYDRFYNPSFDFPGGVKGTSIQTFSGTDLDNHTHTKSEITDFPTIIGTYSKPSTGIPKTDLASAVQTSLGKADTALQSHQDISGKTNVGTATKFKFFTPTSGVGGLNTIDISSIPPSTNFHVDIELTIYDSTKAIFGADLFKPLGSYLQNVGGYYYSSNFYGSIFVNLSASQLSINTEWTKIYGGGKIDITNSNSKIYIYTIVTQ